MDGVVMGLSAASSWVSLLPQASVSTALDITSLRDHIIGVLRRGPARG